MLLVIDGYNLIKIAYNQKIISDKFRDDFLYKLNQYTKIKNLEAIVVFDDGNNPYPFKENIKEVIVIYSGYKQSADDVIKDLILQKKTYDLLIVTSDGELQRYAKKQNVEVINVQLFYTLLMAQEENQIALSKQKDEIFKTSGNEQSELDELMYNLPNVVIKKQNDIIKNKNSNAFKESKKQKKINQKIRKL